ncbi:YHS domain-containing protein [Myxococcota bacterium]|nr:YHS domain-containing protein [Myxococcota bacterium]
MLNTHSAPLSSFSFPRFSASLLATALLATLALLHPSPGQAIEPVYTALFSDLAVGGYDPVAYFDEGRPVEGKAAFELEWKGATWRFASAEHRARFEAKPEQYAPRYGGYCAWAMADGREASGDPRYWKIVDGKLYLNYDASVQKKWETDIPGFIKRADQNWPRLLAE